MKRIKFLLPLGGQTLWSNNLWNYDIKADLRYLYEYFLSDELVFKFENMQHPLKLLTTCKKTLLL